MSKDKYTPPVVQSVGDDSEGEDPIRVEKTSSPSIEHAPKPPVEKPVSLRLGIGEYINAQGDAASEILKNRITRHLQYVAGELSFAEPKDKSDEQGTFVDLILNTLEMDFEKFTVVTDYFLTALREKGIDGTKLRRFITSLDGSRFDRHKITVYSEYATFLTRIAQNWSQRHKLNKLIDAHYAVRDLSPKGKENVMQYFATLVSV